MSEAKIVMKPSSLDEVVNHIASASTTQHRYLLTFIVMLLALD
jgi:hypothetical protein